MTNPCMPGLVKVTSGASARVVEGRGVAASFVVAWLCEIDDPKIERLAHAKLG
jgi:hypothetical protein